MNDSRITFLYYLIILLFVLTFDPGLSYSSPYTEIDNKIIPLLIPPYKHSDYLSNDTVFPIINTTYVPLSSR